MNQLSKVFDLTLILLTFALQNTTAQVFLDANNDQDAYSLIKSKGYGIEETSLHTGVKHITQKWDNDLNKYVFVFTMHKDIDGDREKRVDRQRLEIKTYGPSPENIKAGHEETHYYRWKFKLDKDFQPSPNFCHIHQLKAGDGPDAGAPIITITPRYGSPDKLQLIYTPSSGVPGRGTLKQVDLNPFKGEWIEAIERVVYSDPGEYHLVLRRVKDDVVLFEYESNALDLWREGSTFIRPKFGIYRSLNSLSYWRDEQVLLADFSLTEGTTFTSPGAPSQVTLTKNGSGEPVLSWKDNSNNEDQFRIDVSMDGGTSWHYLSCSPAGTEYWVVKGAPSENTVYRVRAENTLGNSDYAESETITGVTPFPERKALELFSYPNPFIEQTKITYSIPFQTEVKLVVYNQQGCEVDVIVDKVQQAGEYEVKWVPGKDRTLNPGCYFARLTTEYTQRSILLSMIF
ncbi:hypothetical protein [Draconibacterium sediminis]|uniref:hypothetical protein n=1 Tax=Draconibacterium sediminis TaxID=1544798 RepID=UPI0012F8B01B|nr:hypothetical protein [Draconibacterium sediminis]